MSIESIYAMYRQHRMISTDSRTIPEGCLFFALKGESFDGNAFAMDALAKGAAFAVIDDARYAGDPRLILVDHVLSTLQQLAHHHRRQFTIPFIAICGSNGKTTTKELVHAVLAQRYKTIATRGNLNNHIGVPLTLLSIPDDTEMAVIEIGANHIGETAELCAIAAPDFGMITNNGKDHLEGFGSLEGVRQANGELYEWLRATDGWAFVNEQQPDLMEMAAGIRKTVYGAGAGCDVVVQPEPDQFLAAVNVYANETPLLIRSQLAGMYNTANMAAAIAIGLYFGVPAQQIQSAIENYAPGMNRSQLLERDGVRYVLDCYNANPSSMALSLESFSQTPGRPKMVILGDMLELGDYSLQEHKGIVDLVKSLSFDQVVLIGPWFGHWKHELECLHFDSAAAAASWFHQRDWNGWNILLKGSRGYKLETILVKPT